MVLTYTYKVVKFDLFGSSITIETGLNYQKAYRLKKRLDSRYGNDAIVVLLKEPHVEV